MRIRGRWDVKDEGCEDQSLFSEKNRFVYSKVVAISSIYVGSSSELRHLQVRLVGSVVSLVRVHQI